MQFDGQQSGETVLYVIEPHSSKFILSTTLVILVLILTLSILLSILSYVPVSSGPLRSFAVVLCLSIAGFTQWWLWKTKTKDKTYITNRRIIRFDVVTPFFTNKRALFWNETLKVKAYSSNMLFRLFKIGTLQIEPVAAQGESIVIPDVYFHEDLANYIDKIMFTFKNKSGNLSSIQPFITKPKGARG